MKLVKIGAKVAEHSSYVTFQPAKVAVPRDLFREILRLIDTLRPIPALVLAPYSSVIDSPGVAAVRSRSPTGSTTCCLLSGSRSTATNKVITTVITAVAVA